VPHFSERQADVIEKIGWTTETVSWRRLLVPNPRWQSLSRHMREEFNVPAFFEADCPVLKTASGQFLAVTPFGELSGPLPPL
jgi:hypothetical protein